MKKALPIGITDYQELKSENYYAVDKTMMIYDFLKAQTKVTLITRPRRFGKTLNMSMMAEFFDITKDSKEIFKDTKIMETKYAAYLNQYPVIYLSFAGAKGSRYEIVKQIKLKIRDIYDRYEFIFTKLSRFKEDEYHKVVLSLMGIEDERLDNATNSLSFLMEQMQKYYNKKVMVFIDEYDTPFIEAHAGGFYDDIRQSLSSLLHNALKTSNSLQYGMLTGIQRVAK
ncbi:AAA family ATPase, partial [uncultured Thomasclavelia sp.]|uniref:AAA family ATPase n=1 Tax=uncultured Thomasclavelia sp. TaxID=3025759 RepID=UPI0025FAAA23